jgi:hypothetical protein
MAKVRIKKLPKALSGLEIKMQPGLYGTNGNRQFTLPTQVNSQKFAQQPIEVRSTLQPVAREGANLEAEKGETAVLNMGGIPAHFKIGGKRHSQGGTPLNLPDNSFIFSDTAKMKIKDPVVLAQFGMVPKKSGYTPAEIAKKYDINKYRQILSDPNSEDVDRKTAEMMISNYNYKLAKLALIQESMKGFPQGIPLIAMPYIMENEIDPSEYMPTQGQQEQPDADTGEQRYGGNIVSQFDTKAYGGVPMAQKGLQPNGGGFWGNVLNVLEAPQRATMYLGTGIADVVSDIASGRDIDWDARYEMPSETLKRVAPGAGAGWGVAADLLADPFFISGAVKGAFRMGAKKLAKAVTEEAVEKTAGNIAKLDTYKAAQNILKARKLPVNAKNLEKVTAALKAVRPQMAYVQKATSAKDKAKALQEATKLGQKAIAKVQGKQLTKGAKEAAITAGKKAVQYPVQAATYLGKKTAEKLPRFTEGVKNVATAVGTGALKTGEVAKDVITGPLAYPTAKIINVGSKAYQNEELKEENKALKEQLKEKEKQNSWEAPKPGKSGTRDFTPPKRKETTTDSPYEPIKVAGERPKYYTKAGEPGQLYIIGPNGYEKYNPPTAPVQQPRDIQIISKPKAAARPDTIRGTSEEEMNKLMGIDRKEEGGELYQAKDGVSVSNGKYYYTKGDKVYEITKDQYDAYLAKGDVSYDTADEEARAKAGEKEYEFIDPADQFRFKDKNIGAQTAKTGYKIDPESGFYYDPTGAKGVKPGKAGLDDFVRRHKEIIDNYPGGEPQWRKDQVSAGGKKNKAMDHVVNELNKRHREISGNDLVDPNKPGAYVPGVELFNLPGINKKKAAPVQTQTLPGAKPGKPAAPAGPINRYPPMGILGNKRAPWWKQDIIGISGAAADLARVKRYPPWQATPGYYLPEGTFYDPTRELAANTEAANLAMQSQQAFTNPQQLAAASSVAQGQMAKNAADIMGRYNTQNVTLANQLNQQRTDIMNNASANQAGMNTQLWDKYTTLNQQFDNSRAMARQNLRQRYMDAITNRAKTQALNTLYPNYYTNPASGGTVDFAPGYSPTVPSDVAFQNDYQKALDITGDPSRALEYLRIQKGTGKGSQDNSYYNQQGYDS